MKSFGSLARLYEATTDQIVKEFEGKVPDEIVADVMDADPTPSLQYARPLLNLYRRAPYETNPKELGELLQIFGSLARKKKLANADIGSYKSFDDLRKIAVDNQSEIAAHREAETKKHLPANPMVHRDDDWQIQELTTHAGSRFFCPSETHGWCTGYKSDDHWKHYDPGHKGTLLVLSRSTDPDDIESKLQMYVPKDPSKPIEMKKPHNTTASVQQFVADYPETARWIGQHVGRDPLVKPLVNGEFPVEGLPFNELPPAVQDLAVENNRDIYLDNFSEQVRDQESYWNDHVLPAWATIDSITEYDYGHYLGTEFTFTIDDKLGAAINGLNMPDVIRDVPGLGDVPLKTVIDLGILDVYARKDGTISWERNNNVTDSLGRDLFAAMKKPYGVRKVKRGRWDLEEITDDQKDLNYRIDQRFEEFFNHYPDDEELYQDWRRKIGREIVAMYDDNTSFETISSFLIDSGDRFDEEGNTVR